MPSLFHEAIVTLFRERPSLALELMVRALGASEPSGVEARIESSELGDVVSTEYRADLVVVHYDSANQARLAAIVEVQLRADPRKRFTWPVYLTTLRARYGCEAVVLVIAANEQTAAWAAEPIDLGGGSWVVPLAIGPAAVPRITDASEARKAPELAVLSALAHAHDAPEVAREIAVTAFAAVADLDDDRCRFYTDLIGGALPEALRAALENEMEKHELQWPFARKHFAAGRVEGIGVGKLEGRVEGQRAALLVILAARDLRLTIEYEARLQACEDLAVIERWIGRAARAESIDGVFDA